MGAIRVFLVSSMDGYYLPLNLQRLHGFEVADYENLYQDANIILTTLGGYAKLENKESNKKKQMYKVNKDRSLLPYDNDDTNTDEVMTIEKIKGEKKGSVLVIGNDNKLNNYLFEKNWVDEIILCQFPLVLGKGRRSFPAIADSRCWNVKGYQFFEKGITMIVYEKIN